MNICWLNCWKFTLTGVDALSVCVTFVFRSFQQQLQWESAAPWWWHRKRRHTRLRSKTQTSVGAATSIWTERRALPHTPVKHHYSYNTQKSAHHSNVISFPWDSDEVAFYELQLALVGSCEWGRGEKTRRSWVEGEGGGGVDGEGEGRACVMWARERKKQLRQIRSDQIRSVQKLWATNVGYQF